MTMEPFGVLPDGTRVERCTLTDGTLTCSVLTWGAVLQQLLVPDRHGRATDVLLGLDTLEAYLHQDKFLGALVGRFANRIGGASFDLDGISYPLAANDGANHLHGGPGGFHSRVWTVEEAGDSRLVLSLHSPDGEEGYPGAMEVQVTYALSGGALHLSCLARCDRPTLCNLTSHAYFNLSGHDSGPVTDQEIRLFADAYTPTDAASIPTGEIASVAGTPMDLRESRAMGAHIDDDFPQLRMAGGYDHNWVIRGRPGTLRPAARACSHATGIVLEELTTLPGVQFYTGNYLDGCPAGKGGAPYARRWGFCLETQTFPDAPHHPEFPSCVLRPGEEYRTETVYRFSTLP